MKIIHVLLAAIVLAACAHPTDPVVVPNQPESAAGAEARADREESLRAPADSRTEEVESQSGLPTAQSQ